MSIAVATSVAFSGMASAENRISVDEYGQRTVASSAQFDNNGMKLITATKTLTTIAEGMGANAGDLFSAGASKGNGSDSYMNNVNGAITQHFATQKAESVQVAANKADIADLKGSCVSMDDVHAYVNSRFGGFYADGNKMKVSYKATQPTRMGDTTVTGNVLPYQR